jgi:hypothetical protein
VTLKLLPKPELGCKFAGPLEPERIFVRSLVANGAGPAYCITIIEEVATVELERVNVLSSHANSISSMRTTPWHSTLRKFWSSSDDG